MDLHGYAQEKYRKKTFKISWWMMLLWGKLKNIHKMNPKIANKQAW